MTDNDTTVEDMKKTLKCGRVGRVVSFENPPNSQADQAVIMNLCEVEVFGFNFSGIRLFIFLKRKMLND